MSQPRPIGMRIPRPYDTEDDFIRGDGLAIGRLGMILIGAPKRPPGITVRFEVLLRNEQPVFRGEGRVVAHRIHANGREGLEIRFTRLDSRSKALVEQVLELRRTGALTPLSTSGSPLSAPPEPEPKGTDETPMEAETGRTVPLAPPKAVEVPAQEASPLPPAPRLAPRPGQVKPPPPSLKPPPAPRPGQVKLPPRSLKPPAPSLKPPSATLASDTPRPPAQTLDSSELASVDDDVIELEIEDEDSEDETVAVPAVAASEDAVVAVAVSEDDAVAVPAVAASEDVAVTASEDAVGASEDETVAVAASEDEVENVTLESGLDGLGEKSCANGVEFRQERTRPPIGHGKDHAFARVATNGSVGAAAPALGWGPAPDDAPLDEDATPFAPPVMLDEERFEEEEPPTEQSSVPLPALAVESQDVAAALSKLRARAAAFDHPESAGALLDRLRDRAKEA